MQTFRIIPGTWHVWHDGESTYSTKLDCMYFVLPPGHTYIGSFKHKPSAAEIQAAVEAVFGMNDAATRVATIEPVKARPPWPH